MLGSHFKHTKELYTYRKDSSSAVWFKFSPQTILFIKNEPFPQVHKSAFVSENDQGTCTQRRYNKLCFLYPEVPHASECFQKRNLACNARTRVCMCVCVHVPFCMINLNSNVIAPPLIRPDEQKNYQFTGDLYF